MTDLFLVRSEPVPVEELRKGDRLILPNGRRVNFERVDTYDDGATLIARWWRPAERGEPGHPGGKNLVGVADDVHDGRYLGSLVAVPPGHCWMVDRG